ncbi:MAG: LptA/OstA family protein, partial [Candidatus Binataceae bacterium]
MAVTALLFGAQADGAGGKGQARIPPFVVAAHRHRPINVSGNQVIYQARTDTFIVRGNAVLTQGPTVLKADEIRVMRREHRAKAVGHVHLIDPEGVILAKSAKINFVTETAELTDGDILARNSTYHLKGKKIRKLIGQQYVVQDGFFTTCGCQGGTPDWSISGQRMNVRMGDEGTATNARFNILGVP